MTSSGLEAVFLRSRDALLRFLRAHGAGDAAEDLLHELWFRVSDEARGPIAQPLAYLYRAADNLMRDRYRSERQAAARDRGWSEATAPSRAGQSDDPSAERILIARETLGRVERALSALGPRAEQIFRLHRLDGISQKAIAAKFGVSLSTVEADLRKATRALVTLYAEIDQGSEPAAPSKGQDRD